jgi:hypothetical protein
MRFKIGPRTKESGCTQGSVSAKITCDDSVTKLDRLNISDGSANDILIRVAERVWGDLTLKGFRLREEKASVLIASKAMQSNTANE